MIIQCSKPMRVLVISNRGTRGDGPIRRWHHAAPLSDGTFIDRHRWLLDDWHKREGPTLLYAIKVYPRPKKRKKR